MATSRPSPALSASEEVRGLFTPVLARLSADAAAHFGFAPLQLIPSGMFERPASHLLHLKVVSGERADPVAQLFVKVFKPKQIEGGLDAMRQRVVRDYEATRRAYTAMLPYSELGTVPPVACYPDLLAIVTQQVEGPTLLEYLQTRAAWFPPAGQLKESCQTMATVGRWIKVFQTTKPTGGYITTDDLRRYIDHRLLQLVRHAGRHFTQNDRAGVLRYIDFIGQRIGPEELREVFTHSDMSLGNILVSGRRVVVLDFAMARNDCAVHDIAKVFLQLDLLRAKPQINGRVIRQLQGALLEGFEPSLKVDTPLFRLVMLLHRVNHLTGLTVHQTSVAESLYNRVVRGQHQRWIAAELSRGTKVAERP